jgi:hypothetical protein
MKPQEPVRTQFFFVLMNNGKNEAINCELEQDIFICVLYFSWKESSRHFIDPGNKKHQKINLKFELGVAAYRTDCFACDLLSLSSAGIAEDIIIN